MKLVKGILSQQEQLFLKSVLKVYLNHLTPVNSNKTIFINQDSEVCYIDELTLSEIKKPQFFKITVLSSTITEKYLCELSIDPTMLIAECIKLDIIKD